MIAGLISDLRHAVRLYLKTPWQSALAVVMLAAAMALVAAMSSLWSDLYLTGTQGVEDDRGLVTIGLRDDLPRGLFNFGNLEEYIARTQTLQSVAAINMFASFSNVDFEGEPLTDIAEPVHAGYFEALQPRMHLGAAPAREDLEGEGARILVLSHRFWQERLDGDPDIVGREIEMAGERWRVIGVADLAFTGIGWRVPAFWLPWRRHFSDLTPAFPDQMLERLASWRIVGRTVPGISARAVEAELDQVFEDFDFSNRMGRAPRPGQALAVPGVVANPSAREAARRQVSLLLAASVLVAAVAAVNIGIFLLARAPARRRELALRQTLGAVRRRLAAQLITEAGVLVIAATAMGVMLSLWLAALIRELAFLARAGFSESIFNLPALGMTAGLAAVFTMLVALVPIAMVRGRNLGAQSRQVSARPGPFQHIAGLVQLSLAGLVGSAALGFLVHTWLMENRDLGLTTDQVTVAPVTFAQRPGTDFQPPGPEAVFAFREAVRERVQTLPGVRAVSFGRPLPGSTMSMIRTMEIEGHSIDARWVIIAPGFFSLTGIPILHGRGLDSDDERGLVVSRNFAEQVWGETDVVGRFAYYDDGEPDENGRILGVVEDVRYDHPDTPPVPMIYGSGGGFGAFQADVLIAGEVEPARVRDLVNEALATRLDLLEVGDVTTLAEIVREMTVADRARAMITGLYGIVIALMAGFGFFAMQRFLVDAGMRETAIRMALGAGPRLTRRHVFIQGLMLGLPGLVIGTLLAMIAAAWLTDDLISADVSAIAIGAAVGIVLLILMLVASLQPAMRAARLRPGDLLREE